MPPPQVLRDRAHYPACSGSGRVRWRGARAHCLSLRLPDCALRLPAPGSSTAVDYEDDVVTPSADDKGA